MRLTERIMELLEGKKSPLGLDYTYHMINNYLYGRTKVADDNRRTNINLLNQNKHDNVPRAF